MAPNPARAALDRAAEALQQSARSHKRAEQQHRRQARNLMRDLDQLRTVAASFGIELQIDTAKEAQS